MYDAFRLIGEYFLPLWLILSNFGSFGSRILVPGKNIKLPGSRADKLTHFLSPCPRVGNLSFSMFCHFYPGLQFSSDIFFLEIFTSASAAQESHYKHLSHVVELFSNLYFRAFGHAGSFSKSVIRPHYPQTNYRSCGVVLLVLAKQISQFQPIVGYDPEMDQDVRNYICYHLLKGSAGWLTDFLYYISDSGSFYWLAAVSRRLSPSDAPWPPPHFPFRPEYDNSSSGHSTDWSEVKSEF